MSRDSRAERTVVDMSIDLGDSPGSVGSAGRCSHCRHLLLVILPDSGIVDVLAPLEDLFVLHGR